MNLPRPFNQQFNVEVATVLSTHVTNANFKSAASVKEYFVHLRESVFSVEISCFLEEFRQALLVIKTPVQFRDL